jgi:hypothetical protein
MAAGILDEPASSQPCRSLTVRVGIPTDVIFHIQVEARKFPFVTVGDVLGQVQHYLRQPMTPEEAANLPHDVHSIVERRILTVHGGRVFESQVDMSHSTSQDRERATGPRRVDQLMGRTRFEGFSGIDGNQWPLRLAVPERYQEME